MGTPFKMKGSPFQRNFGIGSPVKQQPDKKEFIENYVNPTVNLTKKQTGPVEDGSGGANFTKTNSTEKTGKLPQIDVNPAKYPGKKGNGSVNTDTDTDTDKLLRVDVNNRKRREPTEEDDVDDNRKKVLLKKKEMVQEIVSLTLKTKLQQRGRKKKIDKRTHKK
jgi:hypothetical protein